jgi:ribosomal protein S18 acetylase RimI-like enzyme
MSITLREMTARDYDGVCALWRATPGVGLSDSDSREGVARFLDENPGTSFVAADGDRLIGAVLCGHDGRRGYITHLAVTRDARLRGVGRGLVERCLAALQSRGIAKCHLFVFTDNTDAQLFWRAVGWTERAELGVFSRFTDGGSDR